MTLNDSEYWSLDVFSPVETIISDVFVDASSIGGSSHLTLNDLGENGDMIAGDSSWSAQIPESVADSGVFYLPIHASDVLGETYFGLLQIDIIAGSVIKYEDRTGETGLEYEGQPYSSVTLDFDGNEFKDMFISIEGQPGRMFLSSGLQNDVPLFEGTSANQFPDGPPPISLLGLAVADYNNDGDQDIFCASQDQPRLYAAHEGAFRDSTSEMGLNSVALESVAASWGDFDKDGRVDLAIGRAEASIAAAGSPQAGRLPDVLLHNDTGSGGGFTDVSAEAGILATEVTNCATVTWCDVDSNGYPDLFFGDTKEDPRDGGDAYVCHLYFNNGDGTFTEDWPLPLMGSHVSGIECADLNNDEAFDIVLSSQNAMSRALMNDGNGNFYLSSVEVFPFSLANETSGLRVFDHDLDGLQDILFLPRSTNSHAVLMGNFSTLNQSEFKDLTPVVGLNSLGTVGGVIAADFNGDGDLDLFLGREDVVANGIFDAAAFFQATSTIPNIDPPSNNWLSVDLSSPDGGNNTMGIGAVVSLFAANGDPVGTQQVDGGSSRGGQADHTLVFGLGPNESVGSLVIKWPNGFIQTETSVSEGHHTYLDQSSLSITTGTTQGSYEVISNGINLVFAWETNIATPPWRDEVTVLEHECITEEVVLTPSSTDVEHTISRLTDGTFRHELRWNNRPCSVGCVINFKVKSAAGQSLLVESPVRPLSISVCGKKVDIGQ